MALLLLPGLQLPLPVVGSPLLAPGPASLSLTWDSKGPEHGVRCFLHLLLLGTPPLSQPSFWALGVCGMQGHGHGPLSGSPGLR